MFDEFTEENMTTPTHESNEEIARHIAQRLYNAGWTTAPGDVEDIVLEALDQKDLVHEKEWHQMVLDLKGFQSRINTLEGALKQIISCDDGDAWYDLYKSIKVIATQALQGGGEKV